MSDLEGWAGRARKAQEAVSDLGAGPPAIRLTEAADVERALEAARFAVLKARACWAGWVAPPPDFECRLSDEEYGKCREVELPAGRAEHELWESLRVIREQFLGRPPAEAYEDTGGSEDG